ncbi:MAG: protein-export chaperone SecB [Beijerinckiaceae bacterium]|nr:protein-export chaperone SecB [Beijerinckiaceae bacterium]
MADTGSNGTAALPQMHVVAQYTRDLSFENPNAPRSLAPQSTAPSISIEVNVNVNQLAETEFDVTLVMEGKAGEGADLLFSFELAYGGLFRILNVPMEQMHPFVMIECPRMLFPFARQIVADAVRGGGFPPLYIDPIDFMALYQQKAAEAAASGAGQTLS